MEDWINKFTIEDIEKIKLLFSLSNNQEPKEIVTLRVFRDEYLNMIKSNMSKSYYNSVNIAFNWLLDFFTQKDSKPGAQHSLQSIQQKDVEYFLIYLQKKVKSVSHLANGSGNGYMVYFRNLKAAFNKAKEWNYVKENYFLKVKLPKRQKIAPVFINSNELLAISNKIKNIDVKDVVVFAFYTGMRLDEIVNLRWKNVDLQNGIITVGDDEFTTKGRKQRFIPICEEVNDLLTKRRKNSTKVLHINKGQNISTYIFSKSDGKKFTGDYFSRRFKRICRKAELDKSIHFHSLRHSFASNLVQKGVSLYTVKELLGHASISTTEIYSHLNMDSLREAVEKLDTRSEMLDIRQKQKTNLEENSQLQIFSINSGEKR